MELADKPVPTMVEENLPTLVTAKDLERAEQLFPARPILPVEPRPETVKPIAAAISAVMNEVGHVSKGGTNEFHRYKYATMENVLQKVTPLLAKHGLAIIQSEVGRSMFDQDRVVAVEYEFTIMHTSGEVWPERPKQTGMCRCRDSKGGFDDKSFNKCHTSARKYFLLALFQIPTGEEDDADKSPVREFRKIPQKTTEMNDAIPDHDAETGEIVETGELPKSESDEILYYDKMLADAAESGDLKKLQSTWEIDIPRNIKPALESAKERRHKPRCKEVAAAHQ